MTESKLSIIIDSRTAEQKAKDLTRALEALEQTGIRVSRALSGQVTGNNASAASANRASTSIRTLTTNTNGYVAAAQRAEMSNHALRSSIAGIAASALSAATAYAGFKAVLAATDEYKVMEGQIRLVTDSQQQLMSIMQQLTAMSQAAGGELTASVELYAKFANASRDLSGATDEVLVRLTDTVNKFVAIGGSSGPSAAAGIFQFSQAMASGVLRGQEYNSILEQTPGLAKALADGLGVSMGVMRNMANDGELSATVVMNALLKMGDTADKQFGSLERTSKQAFTIIKREIKEATNDIDKNLGASRAFVKTIEGLSKAIEKISFETQTGEINMLTGAIGVLTAVALKSLLTGMKASVIATYEKIAATRASIIATREQAVAELASARSAVLKAQNEQALSVIAANKARATLAQAEAQVASDRAVIASEVQRMNSTRAQIQIEKALEVQRLANQISEQGRQMSIARMAQLRQTEVVVTRELQAAEAQLTATTLAGSQAVQAARTAQTAAIGRQAAATEALNASNARAAASQAALAAATNTTAIASRGLLGFFGGPAGLVLTLAAVAGGIWMATRASDAMKLSIDKLGDSVADATEKFRGLGFAQRQHLLTEATTKNLDNIADLEKAKGKFILSINSAINDVDSKGREQLRTLIADLQAGNIDATDALRKIQDGGLIDEGSFFGKRRIAEMREAASAVESLAVETQKYANRTQALAAAHKEAEEAAKKQAAAAEAAKSAQVKARNPYEKGDSEALKMLEDAKSRYASSRDPSAVGAVLRELEALAKAGKPVSDQMRSQLLSVAKAQDELAAATARGKLETRQATKDQKELARELERRRDAYADLQLDAAKPQQKTDLEFSERIALIREFANRSNGEYTRMADWAVAEQKRGYAEIAMRDRQNLARYTDLVADEKDLIRSKYNVMRDEILFLSDFEGEKRQQALDAVQAAYQKEIGEYKEAEQEKADILRASFDERHRLRVDFEKRLKAIDESDMSPDQKEMAGNVARNQHNDGIAEMRKPYTDLMGELGGKSPELMQLEDANAERMKIIRDAITQEQITKDEARAAELLADQEFERAKRDLKLKEAGLIASDLKSISKAMFGEQSRAYKTMFAMEKAVSIARSIMAIKTSIALAAGSGPFPWSLGAMASIATATAGLVADIQGTKLGGIMGMAHNGIDSVPREGTWLLDKGERVLSPKQNKDFTDYIDRKGKSETVVSGGVNITIENHTSAKFEVQQLSEFDVRIIARDEIARDGGRSTASAMSNPNSDVSKAMSRNYQLERRR
ncbi:MAG: tape measure protein [Pseudomonadota bacterium]|nr:tape measure protein [Pseudomonadota bacterium]